MKVVMLLERVGGVNAGELAGYSEEVADKLVADGKARETEPGEAGRAPAPPEEPEPIVVRMLKSAQGLNVGEIAAFAPDVVERLVSQGHACVHQVDEDVDVVNRDAAWREKRDAEIAAAKARAAEEAKARKEAEAAEKARKKAEERAAREEAKRVEAEKKKAAAAKKGGK